MREALIQLLVIVLEQVLSEIKRKSIMKVKKKNTKIKYREKRIKEAFAISHLIFIFEDIRHDAQISGQIKIKDDR